MLALIEAHREAQADWLAKLALANVDEEAHLPAADAAGVVAWDLADKLMATPPTTLDGLAALLAYLPETQRMRDHGFEKPEDLQAFVRMLGTSLAMARAGA